jgi:RNA polymerase sigma-70 factor (ECF subfamily)
MNPAVTQPPAAPPDDPVRQALEEDATLRHDLLMHARAILGRRLADRPAADRSDKANEAFQETCVRALQKRHDYDSARPVRPWLHGIMNNVLSETTRSLRRSPAQESADRAAWERLAVDFGPDAPEVVLNRLAVAGYLAKLAPDHQEVLQLRFYEGWNHEQIAARLGISPANARVRLCRALNAAKEIAGITPREDRP